MVIFGRAIMEVFQQIQDIGDVFYKQRVTELDGSSDSTAFQQRGMKANTSANSPRDVQ